MRRRRALARPRCVTRPLDGGRGAGRARSRPHSLRRAGGGGEALPVAAIDLGIKAMTPQLMAEHGIEVHVLPAADHDRRGRAPWSRTGCSSPTARATRRRRRPRSRCCARCSTRRIPFFGICFGNQLLGRALGFGTYKLKYGHRGINQPVMDRTTGKVEVTAHNHGFAVDAPLDRDSDTPYGRARVIHVCLNDDVVEGLECLDVPALLRAVPPGGRGRPARRRLPLRPVRRPDGPPRRRERG